MDDFTKSTLGTWAKGPAKITASYFDDISVRIDTNGKSRVLSIHEWQSMYDDLRDAGYTRQ
jgi:hypothetical protein